MILIISTAAMILLFGCIAIVQHRNTHRAKEFFLHSDQLIANLHDNAVKKYRIKFGKDPTGQFHPISDIKS